MSSVHKFFVLDIGVGIFYNVTHKSNEGKKTCMTRSENRWLVRTGGGKRADPEPGAACLKRCSRAGRHGHVTGRGLVGGRERPPVTAGGSRVVPRILRP